VANGRPDAPLRTAPHRSASLRAAACHAAGNQLTGQLAAWLSSARRVVSRRIARKPSVESRRLQGSQIGLAKGAVWSEGVAAPRERSEKDRGRKIEKEREREREREAGIEETGDSRRVLLGVAHGVVVRSMPGSHANPQTPPPKFIYSARVHTCLEVRI